MIIKHVCRRSSIIIDWDIGLKFYGRLIGTKAAERNFGSNIENIDEKNKRYLFYDLSLEQPIRQAQSYNDLNAKKKQIANKPSSPAPTISIAFSGGRKLQQPDEKERYVEGIRIPPKPIEPDNCCMSGCIHCVWDLYREAFEEYQAQRKLANEKLMAAGKPQLDQLEESQTSYDEEDAFKDIPIGIRAFMALEKSIKEKHKAVN